MLTAVEIIYVVGLACYGQWVLFSRLLGWFDRRYGKPWLERRLHRDDD